MSFNLLNLKNTMRTFETKKMKKALILIFALVFSQASFGQSTDLELGAGFGSDVNSFGFGINKNYLIGKKDKFIIGTGLRFTGLNGKNQTFITAPANLTSDDKNIDSLTVASPKNYAMNLIINLGYKLGSKTEVGFNIDAIGLSFGPEQNVNYIRNNKSVGSKASPTAFNALLVGDNDRGSLNSHFYAKRQMNDKWGIKLAYQFLFNELTTTTKIQTVPEANDRFRLKSGMLYLGFTYKLK